MKFKKGDRVKITSSSEYYNDSYIDITNPKDIPGTITDIDYDIHVKWDNKESNCYEEIDLELIEIKFKVGDRVRIKSSSIYYNNGYDSNPKDISGTVIDNNQSSSMIYRVEWDNLLKNSYTTGDLEYAPTKKEILIKTTQKPTQNDRSKNTSGIKVCRPTPTISTNERSTGNGVRGNRKRVTITVGYLGYKKVFGQ